MIYEHQRVNNKGAILKEIYAPLADKSGLSTEQRNYGMKDGRNHWKNRVQQSKRKLKDEGIIINVKRGVWGLSQKGIDEIEKIIFNKNKH